MDPMIREKIDGYIIAEHQNYGSWENLTSLQKRERLIRLIGFILTSENPEPERHPTGTYWQAMNDAKARYLDVVRAVTDLVDVATMVLERLDLEAKDKPEQDFPAKACRENLREALRNLDGKLP